jgi:hypothetical protein
MNEEMMKSLASLIDESLAEIEELKKSDRFSASEVKMGDSEGLAGKDKNGSLGKEEEKDEEKDDEEKDDDKDDKKDEAEKAEDDMDKGEGKNSEADPNAGDHKVAKEETGMPEGTAAKAEDCDDMDKGEGKNSEADPNAGHHKMAKSEEESTGLGEEDLKKAREESETLMKSYIDEKVGGLESKLEAIAKAVQDLADAPMPSKGSTYKNVQPLEKSEPEVQSLSKSDVVDKLFELKKSGESVDTVDIASAELGNPSELVKIVNKYNIK